MPHTIYFISHPDVTIDPEVPVTRWPLSAKGRSRMEQLFRKTWIEELSAIYCSDEQKAIDGAEILSNRLGLNYTQFKELGENDRSSTGFLEPPEFEATANCFFSSPDTSIRGWETAKAAQDRIVKAVQTIDREDETEGPIAIVSHGAVGTLLYCFFAGKPIDRQWDQPGAGGGNFIKINMNQPSLCTWWRAID